MIRNLLSSNLMGGMFKIALLCDVYFYFYLPVVAWPNLSPFVHQHPLRVFIILRQPASTGQGEGLSFHCGRRRHVVSSVRLLFPKRNPIFHGAVDDFPISSFVDQLSIF